MIVGIEDLKNTVAEDDFGKVDFTVPTRDVIVMRNGALHIPKDGIHPFHMNDHALSQISSRLGIPTRYSKKCMEQEPELFADHANYWIQQEEWTDKKWFLRSKGEIMRAVLSDRYSTLDNGYLIETLETVLGSGETVDIKNLSIDPRYFNLRMVFNSMNVNLGTLQTPDNVMVGIHITNSEVGSSSLRIDSCLYRLVCSNGMISRVGGESMLAQRHANLTDSEMQNRVSKAIVEAVRVGDESIDKFGRLQEVKVDDPFEEIKRLAKAEKYSEKFVDHLKENYVTEKAITQDDNAFTLVNAFTRSAKSMPTFDRRVEVETFAGKLMDKYLK